MDNIQNRKKNIIVYLSVFFIIQLLFQNLGPLNIISSKIIIFILSAIIISQIITADFKTLKSISLTVLLSASIFAIFTFIIQNSRLYFLQNRFAALISAFMSYFVTNKINPGYTQLGFHLSLFMISSYLIYIIFKPIGSTKFFIRSLTAFVIVTLIYYAVILFFHEFLGSKTFKNFHTFYAYFPIVYFILLIIPVSFLFQNGFIMDYSSRKKIFFTLIIPAAVLLVFFVQLYKYSNPIRFKVPSKKILFLTQKGLYDFNKPEPDKYGLSDMGMFGMFENFLQTIDIETSRTSVINNSVLSQSSLLIIINTTQELSVQEHKSLWQFVESGGGLLVLGDHTDMNGMMKPLNNILTPSGISFNFDSAMYLKKNWDDGYSCFYNPVFKGVRAHEEFNFSVGASLSVNSSARPVLEGRYGYSDTGDYNNAAKSFLGDYKFNPGEKYGNLILVAESRYEKGKVIVFGDTSTFQTFSLYSSEIFIRNIISYLTCKKINKALPPEKLIQADISHSEKFIRFNMGAESISPMIMAAYRRNMFFRFITSFDDLNKASLNIINAPVKKISGDEISKINSYLKDGGNVILSAGYDEYEACRDFLNGHKIKIESVPLGQTDSNGLDEDFIFSNVWALNPGDDSFEIIARVWDYPVIAMKNVGKGKLVIVADSRFFLSENMEEQSGYIRGNCNFTKKLYERIFERDKNPD